VKPHIAILFEFPSLSGGEFSMLSVLKQINQFEISAWLPTNGPLADKVQELNIPVINYSTHTLDGKLKPPEALEELRPLLKQHSPDLLHANSLSMSRLLGAIADELSIPTTGHLRDIMKLSRKAINDVNQNQKLIAVSQATADFHIQQGLSPDKVSVIHNGVDLDQFQPREKGPLRQELGLLDSAILIGTVGQICLRKGHDLLPKVATQLDCEGNHIHFCLVGERYSTKQESIDFDAAIDTGYESLGLSSHAHRLGFRDDIPLLLNEFDLLFHPARQEPLGRVLLEAAASGCPIVATNIGGTSEIVEHNQSALLFPVDDAETAAQHIQRVLTDADFSKKLASAARHRMKDHFQVNQAAERLAEFWKSQLLYDITPN
jgi:glycosyltransferase involved in cell wall biosynthesis